MPFAAPSRTSSFNAMRRTPSTAAPPPRSVQNSTPMRGSSPFLGDGQSKFQSDGSYGQSSFAYGSWSPGKEALSPNQYASSLSPNFSSMSPMGSSGFSANAPSTTSNLGTWGQSREAPRTSPSLSPSRRTSLSTSLSGFQMGHSGLPFGSASYGPTRMDVSPVRGSDPLPPTRGLSPVHGSELMPPRPMRGTSPSPAQLPSMRASSPGLSARPDTTRTNSPGPPSMLSRGHSIGPANMRSSSPGPVQVATLQGEFVSGTLPGTNTRQSTSGLPTDQLLGSNRQLRSEMLRGSSPSPGRRISDVVPSSPGFGAAQAMRSSLGAQRAQAGSRSPSPNPEYRATSSVEPLRVGTITPTGQPRPAGGFPWMWSTPRSDNIAWQSVTQTPVTQTSDALRSQTPARSHSPWRGATVSTGSLQLWTHPVRAQTPQDRKSVV